MCGICGAIAIDDTERPVSEATLNLMTDAMAHRGPDDRGTFLAHGVALGARRLSIVDVGGGHQPFSNEDGLIVAVQNGELYGHEAIRQELEAQGHVFTSRCDTEILPHLYERDGDRFVDRLRGKFAAVVWDGRRRRAVVVRDRLGVKPLYWTKNGNVVAFASELKSLVASGLVDRTLDHDAIDTYLTLGYFPAPQTPFAGVYKLPPGGFLTIDGGTVSVERFWEYPLPEPEFPARAVEAYAEELLVHLREAVRLRLMSDVPLGAMLSGGLDSSLIVALMAELSSTPVKTFAVGFKEDGNHNELAHAAFVARHFGCEHHELELSVADTDVDLDTIVWHLDEPVAELSTLGFYALSRLAQQHVTVALSGQGADELFGGYRKHLAARIVDLSRFPRVLAASMRLLPLGGDDKRRMAAAAAARTPSGRLLAMSAAIDDEGRRDLYGPALTGFTGKGAEQAISSLASRLPSGASALGTTLYLDAQLALVDNMLHYFDRMSMATSLEVRVPYLDHPLVEWAARLPDSAKVGLREQKRVLRCAARPLVPTEVVDRPKVAFFRRSAAAWLEAQLAGDLGLRLVESRHLTDVLIDRDALRGIVDEFRQGERSGTQLLLGLVVLDAWLDRFTDTGTPTSSRVDLDRC